MVWLAVAGGFLMEVGRCEVGGGVYSCPRDLGCGRLLRRRRGTEQ